MDMSDINKRESKQKVILISGAVTCGKTSFLVLLEKRFYFSLHIDGFLAKAPERVHNSKEFASGYILHRTGKQEAYPWATPKKNNTGYLFDENTQDFLDNKFARNLTADCPDILLLDELGKLELRGAGFEKVLYSAINSKIKVLVCTVKKRVFNDIVKKYRLQNSILVDLDIMDKSQAFEKIAQYVGISLFCDSENKPEIGT